MTATEVLAYLSDVWRPDKISSRFSPLDCLKSKSVRPLSIGSCDYSIIIATSNSTDMLNLDTYSRFGGCVN